MNAEDRDVVARICFVTTDFAGVIRNGGIGTHFWLMSKLLAKRGWDVHVLFCGAVGDEPGMESMPARLAAEGISFTWLDAGPEPAWWRIPSFADNVHTLLLSQRALETLEGLHAQHRFDLIEFADWGALGFRAIQAKRMGAALADVRLAVKLHSTTEWQRRVNLEQRKSSWDLKIEYCEQYAFEHADVQFSPTRYMVEDTRAAGWDVREDVIVASPFPFPQQRPTAQLDQIAELVFFGRLERRKGLDIFLDALEEMPLDLPVLFLGRDNRIGGRNACEIIDERVGPRPCRIETDLDREHALAELQRGDRLAVITSRSETFGFTVAECITNKIPFVAARAGGIPEVIPHPEARERWLFEPTVPGLVNALRRRLVADGAEERSLRAEVAATCDSDRWNDQVEASYRAAIALPLPPQAAPTPEPSTVSVAVTHHNHAAYLPEALASLAAQTRLPDEVFVIDDGSTDRRALEVFDAQETLYPEWTFIRQGNSGPGLARNRCLERASGTYFLAFDSDNIATSQLLETLVDALERDVGLAVATCHHLAFTDSSEITAQKFAFRFAPTGGPRILAALENVFGDTCSLFRSEALRSVGGFEVDPSSPYEDWLTLTKMAFSGEQIDVVPRPLFFYRTEVGGRLSVLGQDPALSFRHRREMIEHFLVRDDLTSLEWTKLWECFTAFGAPNDDLALLRSAHEDMADWAHRTIADANAWHESQLEDLRAFLHGQLDAANDRAERSDLKLLEIQAKAEAIVRRADISPEMVPTARLWRDVLRRTFSGGRRRARAWRRSVREALRSP